MWGGYILGTVFLRYIPVLLFLDHTNLRWIRLTIAPIFLSFVGMLYLFPYTKLIKIADRYSHLKTKANSKTALISATAAFLVIGLSVFFITSVFVAQHLAPDLVFYFWWEGEYWLGKYGVRLLFHLVVSLPPALAYGMYSAKRTFYRCGGQLASSHPLGDSSLISNAD